MQWLSMGGYSTYVWPAYGLVGLVLVINILNVKFQREQTQKKIKKWFKSQSL